MAPLRCTQRGELESVISSQGSSHLRGDDLLAAAREWDFQDNGFTLLKRIGDERAQTTLTQIACPPLKACLLLSSLQANIDPRLEAMPG
jgi:hypothetical protein